MSQFPAQIKIPATYMRGGTSKGVFFKLSDLPLLAQIGASDKVAFHLIDIADAERIAAAFQHDLELLKTGVRLCSNHYLG